MVRQFDTMMNIAQFIDNLSNFQMSYLSPTGSENLRIVLHQMDDSYFNDQRGIADVNLFIQALNRMRCTYPVLFFTQNHWEEYIERGIYDQYPYMIRVSNLQLLKEFVQMNEKWRQWLKQIKSDKESRTDKEPHKRHSSNLIGD